MNIALLLSALSLGADAPAVTKAPAPPPPAWNEMSADPLLTVLQSPDPAKWLAVDEGCDLRPAADGRSATFAAGTPGRYRLVVVPEKGEPVRVCVVVGKPEPTPPGPKPPEPRPVPTDPLVKKLQTEFDKDTRAATAKISDLKDLVELYRQAADLAASADVTSTGQLVTRVRDAARAMGIEGLADLRRAVSVELTTAMPTDEPMTAELRAKAKDVFLRIRAALQGVQ